MCYAFAPTRSIPARPLAAVALVMVMLFALCGWSPAALPTGTDTMAAGATLPLAFVPNVGQQPDSVVLEARGLGGAFAFTAEGVRLAAANGANLHVQFVDAQPQPRITGIEPLDRRVHFYNGTDPARWRSDVPAYNAVHYAQLYPGIDLRYDGDASKLKSTYFVAPDADWSRIGWRYDGAQSVVVGATGDLRIVAASGATLAEKAPIAWQEIDGQRVSVAVGYRMTGDQVGFAVGAYDTTQPLVIDPDLVYSSYVGGNSDDDGRDIALDAAGNIYITGYTYSDMFLNAPGTIAGSDDAFVAKFDPTGKTLIYSAFIGGKSTDKGSAITVTPAGEVVLAVYTTSLDFPLKNALHSDRADTTGALVKLAANGAIVWSTYLPIDFNDTRRNIALDKDNNIYLTGQYFDTVDAQQGDIAILKIAADGTSMPIYGHVGDDWTDKGVAIAVGANGNIYLTGTTHLGSEHFPLTANAAQRVCGAKSYGATELYCEEDGFVMVVTPDMEIVYSTLLGGSGSDTPTGIGVDGAGNIYVAGSTFSQNFPTAQALQHAWSGADNFSNGFVTKINVDGSIGYSTYLGATDRYSWEQIDGIAVRADGTAAVTGITNGEYFPVKDAAQKQIAKGICFASTDRICYDAFVTTFAPNGTLANSTYFGGSYDDEGRAIVFDVQGSTWIVGSSESFNLPVTSDAFQPDDNRQKEAFITRFGTQGSGGVVQPPSGKYRVLLPVVRR